MHSSKSKSSKVVLPRLRCDVISAKGLHGIDAQLYQVQWHVKFNQEVRRSEPAILQSQEPVVNFRSEFQIDPASANSK